MMCRSCSLRGRSRPPSPQTADTARLSMSAACFMDSSTLPPIGPFAASPMNDNFLYHSLDRPRAPSMAGSDYQPTKRKTACDTIDLRLTYFKLLGGRAFIGGATPFLLPAESPKRPRCPRKRP